MSDDMTVSLSLNLRKDDEEISIVELVLGAEARPIVVIEPNLEDFTPESLAFDIDATGFDSTHDLGAILKIIAEAMLKSVEDAESAPTAPPT